MVSSSARRSVDFVEVSDLRNGAGLTWPTIVCGGFSFVLSFVSMWATKGADSGLVFGVSSVFGLFALAWVVRNRQTTIQFDRIWRGVCLGVLLVNVVVQYVFIGHHSAAYGFCLFLLATAVLSWRPLILLVCTTFAVACWGVVSMFADFAGNWLYGGFFLMGSGALGWALFFAHIALRRSLGVIGTHVGDQRSRKEKAFSSTVNVAHELMDLGKELQQIVERTASGVVVHLRGKIVYANPAFVSCLRYKKAEGLINRDFLDLVDSIDRTAITEILVPGSQVRCNEFHFVRHDGSRAVLSVAPAQDIVFHGTECALVETRDVTEEHDELRAKLLLADRMAAVGTLAAGVAHEINNPLAYVKLNLSTLSARIAGMEKSLTGAEGAELREILNDTIEGVSRVRDIVRDLKAFSRAEDLSQCAVDVRLLMESSIKMTYNEIRHRAKMRKNFEKVSLVAANPSHLGQVFLNILVNAAQAIEEGNAAENEIYVVTRTDKRGDIVVEIRDTGCGMSEEAKRRVFDPFYTSKPVGVGTGLGMYFCHNVVTRIGGTIEMDSEPGQGTTVRVRLPATRGTGIAPKKSEPVVVEPSLDALKILIIDDERHVGRSLRRILSSHEVELATSGTDGFEKLKSGSYDVVLCDLMMPDITGREIYQRLRDLRPGSESRIVFITGGAFTQDAREFLDSLENPILNKPFEVHALHAVIREITSATSQAAQL